MNVMQRISKLERDKVVAAKDVWLCFQVEHAYIEDTLNELEKTEYEMFQILDGNIWVRFIVRKKVTNAKTPTSHRKHSEKLSDPGLQK